jgi:hypothetical protein
MAGYLVNAGAGSIAYNAIHTYAGPLLLAAYSASTDRHTPLLIALIWISHIGFDRPLGYGLKYPAQFKDTHLNPSRQRIVKATSSASGGGAACGFPPSLDSLARASIEWVSFAGGLS